MVHSKWQTEEVFLDQPKWWYVTRPLHFGIVLGILILSMTLVWYFWTPEVIRDEDIPIIKVQPGPTRIRPDSPGAPEIPHQDKLIYDELTGKKGRKERVVLRDQPEEPLDRESSNEQQSGKKDNFPIANLSSSSSEQTGVIEDPRFEIVLAPKDREKQALPSIPKVEKQPEQKSHKLRTLPLRKLFALNTPAQKSISKRRSRPKPKVKAKKKPFPILPIPKSMLYAKRKPTRRGRRV